MGRIPWLKLFLIGLFSLTLSVYVYYVALSLLPNPTAIAVEKWVENTISEGRLRERPASGAQVVKRLQYGEKLQLISEQENWMEVIAVTGEKGWVFRSNIVYSPPGMQ